MKEPEYTLTKTIERDNATIRVFIPNLSEEERARRTKNLHNAAAQLLKAAIKKERR